MNELISIVVPVYNVEKYLKKSIESIINQTYRNLEIIIIDDGSSDNSYSICKEYAKRDNRIILIHTENNGVSFARNLGLAKTNGKYIIFIDSDDYIERNMIEILYNNAKQYNADISICNYNKIVNNNVQKDISSTEKIKKEMDVKEFYKNIFGYVYYRGFLWNKLLRREILIHNNEFIKFNTKIHMMEDLVYICEIAKNAKRCYYDYDKFLYNYVQRKDSALSSKYSLKKTSAVDAFAILYKYVEKYNKKYLNDFKYDYVFCAMKSKYILKKNNLLNKEKIKQIRKIRRQKIYGALNCKDRNLKEKMKLICLCYFTSLYEWFNINLIRKI